MFTPLHGTITLVAVGVAIDYALRVFGVMVFKTLEILGKKRERARRNTAAASCMDCMNNREDKGEVSHRSRTMNSSTTAVDEEAPLGTNWQFSEAIRKEYRIPGELDDGIVLHANL